MPARPARGIRLSELRPAATAHERPRRRIHADAVGQPPHLQRVVQRLWVGATPALNDRTRGNHTGRRLGSVRRQRRRRGREHHHERAAQKLGRVGSHHLHPRPQRLRLQHLAQRLARYARLQGRRLCLRHGPPTKPLRPQRRRLFRNPQAQLGHARFPRLLQARHPIQNHGRIPPYIRIPARRRLAEPAAP